MPNRALARALWVYLGRFSSNTMETADPTRSEGARANCVKIIKSASEGDSETGAASPFAPAAECRGESRNFLGCTTSATCRPARLLFSPILEMHGRRKRKLRQSLPRCNPVCAPNTVGQFRVSLKSWIARRTLPLYAGLSYTFVDTPSPPPPALHSRDR